MHFLMNNRTWRIVEKTQDEIRQHIKEYKYDGNPVDGKYFGLTYMDEQIIYIDKDLHKEQKKQTILHELMHCYVGCYLFNKSKDYTEEELCDISACSHEIINNIVQKYFGEINI